MESHLIFYLPYFPRPFFPTHSTLSLQPSKHFCSTRRYAYIFVLLCSRIYFTDSSSTPLLYYLKNRGVSLRRKSNMIRSDFLILAVVSAICYISTLYGQIKSIWVCSSINMSAVQTEWNIMKSPCPES